MDSDTYIFHITCVMHNSRISDRMKRYNVKAGKPVILDENQEIKLTEIICRIIKKYEYIILAYNICRDHIHFVILCDFKKLSSIVKTIKSISSREFRKESNLTTNLWADKFNRKEIDKEKQLTNTINYVNGNRIKHDLPENEELKNIIAKILTPIEDAFN